MQFEPQDVTVHKNTYEAHHDPQVVRRLDAVMLCSVRPNDGERTGGRERSFPSTTYMLRGICNSTWPPMWFPQTKT